MSGFRLRKDKESQAGKGIAVLHRVGLEEPL